MKCDPNSVKFTQKMGVPSSWSRHLSLKTNTLTNREERITKKHTCYVKNLSCLPWQSCKHQSSFIGWNTSIPLCMRVEIINSQPHTTISCNVEYPHLTMYYRLYYSAPTWQVLTQLCLIVPMVVESNTSSTSSKVEPRDIWYFEIPQVNSGVHCFSLYFSNFLFGYRTFLVFCCYLFVVFKIALLWLFYYFGTLLCFTKFTFKYHCKCHSSTSIYFFNCIWSSCICLYYHNAPRTQWLIQVSKAFTEGSSI